MIYLIRHGETVWNRAGQKQGRSNSPLTLKGTEQARTVAEKLIQAGIWKRTLIGTSFYMSPLGRAKQTASIIADALGYNYDKFHECEDLQEHAFGSWEGLLESEIPKKQLELRAKDKWNYIVPGGESNSMLYHRINNSINGDGLLSPPVNTGKDGRSNVVIITHEMVSRTIRGVLIKLMPSEILKLDHKQDVIYTIENNKVKCI